MPLPILGLDLGLDLSPQTLRICAAVAGTGLALAALRRLTLGVWWDPVCPPRDLRGKTAVVTGGTTGLGFETALGLAKMGARVIITGRGGKGNESVATAIQERSGNKSVSFLPVDMSSFTSVADHAAVLRKEAPVIDILVENAGMVYSGNEQKQTSDGHCRMFQINYLSHFLLTSLLLPSLLSGDAPSRIVSVSSKLANKADPAWEDTAAFNSTRAYGQSKLAQIMFMRSLQAQHSPRITAVSCMPGLSRTPLLANLDMTLLQRVLAFLFQPILISILRSPKSGAQTILFCAVDPSVQAGEFYDNCKVRPIYGVGNCAIDPAQWLRLWEYSILAVPRM